MYIYVIANRIGKEILTTDVIYKVADDLRFDIGQRDNTLVKGLITYPKHGPHPAVIPFCPMPQDSICFINPWGKDFDKYIRLAMEQIDKADYILFFHAEEEGKWDNDQNDNSTEIERRYAILTGKHIHTYIWRGDKV